MKVIFLDIDGVLNSTRSFAAKTVGDLNQPSRSYLEINLSVIDPIAIALLNKLCVATGADIVLSSTHRKMVDDIPLYLKQLGITAKCVGSTPITDRGFRGDEVNMWLGLNPVGQYVIFDDDSDFYSYQTFIKIDRHVGLDFFSFEKAIELLK